MATRSGARRRGQRAPKPPPPPPPPPPPEKPPLNPPPDELDDEGGGRKDEAVALDRPELKSPTPENDPTPATRDPTYQLAKFGSLATSGIFTRRASISS